MNATFTKENVSMSAPFPTPRPGQEWDPAFEQGAEMYKKGYEKLKAEEKADAMAPYIYAGAVGIGLVVMFAIAKRKK